MNPAGEPSPSAFGRNAAPLLDVLTATIRVLVLTNVTLWVVRCYLRLGSRDLLLQT